MTIIPLLHRVLVRPKPVEKKTESGIILVDSMTRKEAAATEEGTILAIGDTFGTDFGAKVIPQIGDRIYFAKYAGKFIKDENDEALVILNDEDVIAIIKEEA
jgi:chaperonin GroES